MMRKQLPGHPGYEIEIGDEVKCYMNGKVRTSRLSHNTNNSIYWTVDKINYTAERLIQETFPGICPGDYIYQLYKDIPNTANKSVHRLKISEKVVLELLYTPTSYCLITPQSINLKKEIKEMFPGPVIEIEEGDCTAPRREIYFTSKEHLKIVQQKMLDFFSNY